MTPEDAGSAIPAAGAPPSDAAKPGGISGPWGVLDSEVQRMACKQAGKPEVTEPLSPSEVNSLANLCRPSRRIAPLTTARTAVNRMLHDRSAAARLRDMRISAAKEVVAWARGQGLHELSVRAAFRALRGRPGLKHLSSTRRACEVAEELGLLRRVTGTPRVPGTPRYVVCSTDGQVSGDGGLLP